MQKATEMLLKKMEEDKVFAEKILTQTENEKIIELAKAEGIDLTTENIEEANTILQSAGTQKDGELSEEDLENVAGGTIIATAVTVAKGIILSAGVVGATAASVAGVATAAVATKEAYDAYKK